MIINNWFMKNISLTSILQNLIKLFLFILPWQTIWIYKDQYLNGFKWQYGTLGFYATEILLWIIALIFIGWFWKNFRLEVSKFKFKMTKDRFFTLSVLVFIVYVYISSFWALDGELAQQHGLRIMEMFLLFFILFLGPLNFKESARWLVLGSILPAVLGILQFATQDVFASKWFGLSNHVGWKAGASIVANSEIGRMLRSYGPFTHPNVFGGYLVIVMFMLLLWSLSVTKFRFKIILFASYCLLVITLFFTFSRSALLSLPVVLFIYYIANKKIILQKVVSTLLPIFILILILAPVLAVRVSGNSVNEIQSITERTDQVEESFVIIKNNLWFGVGVGNYTLALYNDDSSKQAWEYQPVHNVGLLLLSELGIIGMTLLLLIFINFIRYQMSFIRYNNENFKKRFKFYMLSGICYMLLCLFDHYLYSSYVGLMISGVYWGLITRFNTQYLHS